MRTAQYMRIKSKSSIFPFSTLIKEKSGFTLIEMLVVIAIIGVLTGGAIAAYNNFNQAQTVRRATLNLVTDLRETQSRAVSGVKHSTCGADTNPADHLDDYDLGGHYLVFDYSGSGDATIFRQLQFCVPGSNQNPVSNEIPTDETINFLSGVSISDLNLLDSMGNTCDTLSGNQLTINFLPLEGVEFFADDNPVTVSPSGCTRAQIVISDGTTSFNVEVDQSGQITQN